MKKLERINRKLYNYKKEYKTYEMIEDSYTLEKLLNKAKTIKFPKEDITFTPTYISKEYTIILAKQFLQVYAPTVSSYLESLLTSQNIFWYQSKTSIHKAGYKNKVPFIKLSITNTLQDFIALIHEFFHLTNRKFENPSYPLTRETLSEFISIYFEKKSLLFLEAKGYSKKEVAYFQRKRINDTAHTLERYYYEQKILKVYTKEKGLTLNNTPYKIEKINTYLDKYTFSPFKKMVYILGDILSEYILAKEYETSKVLKLNVSLNELSIFAMLEKLEIILDSAQIEEIISIYQHHIKEVSATFS